MADGQNPATPEGTPAAGTTPPPATPPAGDGTTPTAPAGQAPKLDGPFDEARALRLIENLRGEVASLKAKPATPSPAEPKDEAAERIAALEAKYAAAERKALVTGVSAETGVPAALLVGDDEATVKAHAAQLIEWAKTLSAPAGPAIPGRPTPALQPGQGGQAPAAFDPNAVAKAVRDR